MSRFIFDGQVIYPVLRTDVLPHGQVQDVLGDSFTWGDLARGVREMEREASAPCLLCGDGECNSCPDNMHGELVPLRLEREVG